MEICGRDPQRVIVRSVVDRATARRPTDSASGRSSSIEATKRSHRKSASVCELASLSLLASARWLSRTVARLARWADRAATRCARAARSPLSVSPAQPPSAIAWSKSALAEAELGFGVVDQAAFDLRPSRGRDPALEAARPAGSQEVVERGGDGVRDERRVERVLADRKRLVPQVAVEQSPAAREERRARLRRSAP